MRGENNSNGLYVHIPFCDGKCGYCAFYSILYDPDLADRFLVALERELAQYNIESETIYIGGGTPSVLSVNQLDRLCRMIHRRVAIDNPAEQGCVILGGSSGGLALPKAYCGQNGGARRLAEPSFPRMTQPCPAEWTVEMNPGTLSSEKLAVLVSSGVNRISLGAQSFDERALKTLGRRHSAADTVEAARMIRAAGINNMGLDLIACIPGFGAGCWEETLRRAIEIEPEHVSVYALTMEEGSRLAAAAACGEFTLPDDEAQLDELEVAEELLGGAGYRRYEISNYALTGFECRHNISCWRGEEYLGVGPAAASHAGLERRCNRPDVLGYIEALERGEQPPFDAETLAPAQKRAERLVFGLRMSEGVDMELTPGCLAALGSLQRDGLVVNDGSRWALTARGRNLADYVGAELIGCG